MKKICILLFVSLLSLAGLAQTKQSIDKGKLFDLYQDQKYNDAASYLISIYGNDVSDFKVLTQLGYCYLMGGNTANAEKFYLKANAVQPQNIPILFNLGSIYGKRANKAKAIKYYQEIVNIDSNNFNAYKLLASLQPEPFSKQKWEYLKKANALNPTDADVVFEISEMYITMHLFSAIEPVLRPALEADSNNIRLLKIQLPL